MSMRRVALSVAAAAVVSGSIAVAPIGPPKVACTVLMADGGYQETVEVGGKTGRLCRELGASSLLTPRQAISPGSCACWAPDAGPCEDSNGRTRGFNEALPGTWSGSGCVPKPCGQFAGHRNWPTQCPGG